MEKFDVLIIGAGPGGYNAAIRASKNGLRVLIVEKSKIGGVCLNEGCVPSKSLLYSAKLYDGAVNSEKYGLTVEKATLNQNTVIDRKNKVVRTLTAGVKSALKHAGVITSEGNARLLGKEGDFFVVSYEENKALAKNVIIASGSSPIVPASIKGAREMWEKGFVITNKEILDLREIPQKLVVVGGGVIGLEMASYYNSAGSDVTVIEMMGKIAGSNDKEISAVLLKNYEKKGIKFKLNAKLTEIKEGVVFFEQNGASFETEADKVLISIGRSPNVSELGLETVGVNFSAKGIVTDSKCHTNIPGIYAVGDVNGKMMLAHTAYREGEVVVNSILGHDDEVDYVNIPTVIYTNPEVASIGETEETAAEKELDFYTKTISMRYSGRYLAENEGGDGICKLVMHKRGYILGIHMIANYASEIIFGAGILVSQKMKIDDVTRVVFPHPTVGEIIRDGIFEL